MNLVCIGEFLKGQDMLLCCQVDDMLMAGRDKKVVSEFATELSSKLKVTWGHELSKQLLHSTSSDL
jgi:hypothetical protein